MSDFKDILKKLRQELQLTQEQLAVALEISRSAVSMYERGEREPDFETLETIADYFNVDMNYLLGAPQDGADIGRIINMVQAEYDVDYETAFNLLNIFTDAWCAERNVSGLHSCFCVYFAEHGIKPKKRKPSLRSVARLEELDITPDEDENIRKYIDFLLSQRERDK